MVCKLIYTMANTWFQFKQFRIEQGKTAMKVGTDGVLLGAWTNVDTASTILDVGTGTGLIALMLAQRSSSATILAIDVEDNAVLQAQENVENTPWSDRITVEKGDYRNFLEKCSARYDLIVSNPPFFKQSLKPGLNARAVARHDHQLPHEVLVDRSIDLLTENGRLSIILPYVEGSVFIAMAAAKGLFCIRKTNVCPTPDSGIKRLLLEFSKIQQPLVENNLVVEDKGRHGYSKEYLLLTGDFYLFA